MIHETPSAGAVSDPPLVDVVVIGAGLAGLVAARDLSALGYDVTVVEAAGRIGGRTYARRLSGQGPLLDFGGTWLLPGDEYTMAELERYRIGTVNSPDIEDFGYAYDQRRSRRRGLLPAEQAQLDRALAEIDSTPAESGCEVTLDAWLEHSRLSDSITAWVRGYVKYLYGADPTELAASTLAGVPACSLADVDKYDIKIDGSTRSLVEALADGAQANVLLNWPAESVRHGPGVVTVLNRAGHRRRARAAVVAAPLNALGDIAFEPPLAGSIATLAREGHVGHSTKLWIVATGVRPGLRGLCPDGPLTYIRWERELDDDACLLVAFGTDRELGCHDLAATTAALRLVTPGATALRVDGHDWNSDPWARGSWFCPRPGQLELLSELPTRHGSLVFAGGDLFAADPGSIEGAVRSGADAARALAEQLATSQSPMAKDVQ
ncbi:MAG: flavin monoamine oxidase family protein [Mycobacterium sp.]